MSAFEIAITIISSLMGVLGVIGTIFLNRLLKTLDNMSSDVNGIKVEIGKIVTTQITHEQKFDHQDKRLEKLEDRLAL
jgi:uncharacterized protein YoxC